MARECSGRGWRKRTASKQPYINKLEFREGKIRLPSCPRCPMAAATHPHALTSCRLAGRGALNSIDAVPRQQGVACTGLAQNKTKAAKTTDKCKGEGLSAPYDILGPWWWSIGRLSLWGSCRGSSLRLRRRTSRNYGHRSVPIALYLDPPPSSQPCGPAAPAAGRSEQRAEKKASVGGVSG